jgi:hypothetical protein
MFFSCQFFLDFFCLVAFIGVSRRWEFKNTKNTFGPKFVSKNSHKNPKSICFLDLLNHIMGRFSARGVIKHYKPNIGKIDLTLDLFWPLAHPPTSESPTTGPPNKNFGGPLLLLYMHAPCPMEMGQGTAGALCSLPAPKGCSQLPAPRAPISEYLGKARAPPSKKSKGGREVVFYAGHGSCIDNNTGFAGPLSCKPTALVARWMRPIDLSCGVVWHNCLQSAMSAIYISIDQAMWAIHAAACASHLHLHYDALLYILYIIPVPAVQSPDEVITRHLAATTKDGRQYHGLACRAMGLVVRRSR